MSHILFRDVPLGAVFRHVGFTWWWKRVTHGSVRVNQDGTDHPEQDQHGITSTVDTAPCILAEQGDPK